MDNNKFPPITKPEDYQLIYHSNTDGHIWVDAKGRPIPLTQQLTGHIDTVGPAHLWNSRVTKQCFHAVPPPISKGDTANSKFTFPFLCSNSLVTTVYMWA